MPVTPATRALAVAEGAAGLGMVSLAVSYFSSVYGGYAAQKALAETVYAQAGESADAARLIANHWAGSISPALLALELARLRDGMAGIGSAYANFPILHFFVAAEPRESLLRLLFVTHDACSLLDCAVDPAGAPGLAGLGRRSGLEASARRIRKCLAISLLLGQRRAEREAGAERAEGDASIRAARFARAAAVLREAGIPVREDAAAVSAYLRARDEWEPWIRASAEVLGEGWEEVSEGF